MVPGSVIKLKVVRDGKSRAIDVTLGTLTEKPNELFAGVDVKALGAEDRRRLGIADARVNGLVIAEVAEDSPLRDRLVAGMVVVEVNRTPVTDLASAKRALQPGRNLLVVYFRGGFRFVPVSVTDPGK